jgi:hypothetical protein
MNIGLFPNKISLQPLVLLWLAYAWLGWYLSAHHIVWLVGGFIVAIVLALVWRSIAWLERLVNFGSQPLILFIILSTSVVLVASWSLFLTFILVPLTTTILAEIELRFSGLSKRDTILLLTVLAGLGLAVGEVIDLFFLPSSR